MVKVSEQTYSETGGIEFGRAVGFVAGGIGDQIYHLTQLRSLAGACQTGTIDIACIHPGPISRILAATPWVGRVIDARPIRRYVPGLRGTDTVRALRLHRYDTAFFMHRSTSFKLASAFAGIRSRIGLSDGWVDNLLLTKALPLENGGNRRKAWGHRPFIAAMDEFILNNGLHLDLKTPTILPDRSARELTYKWMSQRQGPVFIVNMFALDEKRRWPVDAAVTTIATIATRHGGTFILNAGPDAVDYHKTAMSAWRSLCKRQPMLRVDQLVDSLDDSASMERDVALYHLADGYIGVDSFTANLAMNCSLPAVIMFASERDRLTYRSTVSPVVASEAGNLGSISVDKVLTAFEKLQTGQPVNA